MMIKLIHAIFIYLLTTTLVLAQTASILPQGKTQFTDTNGKPLTSGTVDFYVPSTTTRKTTWQDSAETTPNANPVILDGSGRAIIWGDGSYRMVVKDRVGNLIYDQVTSSVGTGSSGGTTIGDGLSVGTILPTSDIVAPVNYQFAYGQTLSRTTFPELYQALTVQTQVGCVGGSAVINVTDTSYVSVGAVLESICAAGSPTVISKTSTTVTLSVNSTLTVSTNGRFFPYGNGDALTTFNLPDLRGSVIAGRCNMGGVDCSNLNSTYFSSNSSNTPSALGAKGGTQSHTQLLSEIPNITSGGTNLITVYANGDNTLNVPVTNGSIANQLVTTSSTNNVPQSTQSWVGKNSFFNNNTISVTSSTGGIANSATINAGGSGYTNGSQILTVSGGTCSVQPQFTVTVSGGVASNPVLATAGSCSVAPSNPVATTGGGGTGATLNVTYIAKPYSLLQPTLTLNYIIKVTPDINLTSTFGVASIGGMTGVIACGTNVTCAGNTISVNIPTGSVLSFGGMTGNIACGGSAITCASQTIKLSTNAPTSGQALVGVDSSGNFLKGTSGLPVINLTDYATCDGTTNDTTAINTWMAAFTGKIGYVAPGLICRYTGILVLPSSSANKTILWGYGAEFRQLDADAGSANSGITVGPNTAQTGNSDNVAIYGLTVNGRRAQNTNTQGSAALIYVIGGINFVAKDVFVINGRGDGIYAGGSTTAPFTRKSNQVVWDNVVATNNYRNGGSIVGVDYMDIRGGIFQNSGNTNNNGPMNGIDIEPNGADANSANSDISISGTKFLVNGNASNLATGNVGLSCYTALNARVTISNTQSDSNLKYGYEVAAGSPNQCSFALAKGAANGTALMAGLAYDAAALLSPITKVASYTLTPNENTVTFNCGATCTLTLPAASDFPGRPVNIKTIAAFTVVSASSNVTPLGGGAAGTAILSANAGRYVTLQSDGTTWVIVSGNP